MITTRESHEPDQQALHRQSAASKKIAALEEKLVRKNEVLSELMEEHAKPKKALGDA
jgi:hypothetical protein